jgi:hypothetical protein
MGANSPSLPMLPHLVALFYLFLSEVLHGTARFCCPVLAASSGGGGGGETGCGG